METRPRTGGGGGDVRLLSIGTPRPGRALSLISWRRFRGLVLLSIRIKSGYLALLSRYSTFALSPDARHNAYLGACSYQTQTPCRPAVVLRVHFVRTFRTRWRVLERLRIHGFRCTESPMYFAFSPLEIEVRLRLWPTRRGS